MSSKFPKVKAETPLKWR